MYKRSLRERLGQVALFMWPQIQTLVVESPVKGASPSMVLGCIGKGGLVNHIDERTHSGAVVGKDGLWEHKGRWVKLYSHT